MDDTVTVRRNITVLTAAQALGGSSAPIVMSLGGLVGQQLADNPAWVTLPVSLFGLGLAIGTLPAAFVMRACISRRSSRHVRVAPRAVSAQTRQRATDSSAVARAAAASSDGSAYACAM